MNVPALKRLRGKLASGQPIFGVWMTLESPSLTEMAVALGIDWVVIDAEHGHLDWKELLERLRAAVRSETVALIRLAQRDTALVKRALDIGADGVVIPWVETADQLREAIRDCRYPPEGRRGIGGERSTLWGQCLREHTAEANDHVLVVPIIETVATAVAVPEMCGIDGVEVFFFGPADFSSTAGYRGQWQGPGVAEQILQLKDTIRAAGKHCGVMSTSVEDLRARRAQGFQMLGVGADAGLFLRSLHESLKAVDAGRTPATSFDPRDGHALRAALPRPPETMRPDRTEVVTARGSGQRITLQAGVVFEALVGESQRARDLTTGIVTLEAEALLACHAHPCSESITVLDGILEVAVEGRTYHLGPRDNIVIPRWLPHESRNPQSSAPARAHVALAMTRPERELVTRKFETTLMPNDSAGLRGLERVNRFASARRNFSVGPNTEFIDFFNADLVPGIEISGGWGRFAPTGRLPAHVHDFDESICITEGSATCIVEGRRYTMPSDHCPTAMVPRGRVHYFINESPGPLEMVWVYAGPRPERILVDEVCATAEGSPWL